MPASRLLICNGLGLLVATLPCWFVILSPEAPATTFFVSQSRKCAYAEHINRRVFLIHHWLCLYGRGHWIKSTQIVLCSLNNLSYFVKSYIKNVSLFVGCICYSDPFITLRNGKFTCIIDCIFTLDVATLLCYSTGNTAFIFHLLLFLLLHVVHNLPFSSALHR